MYTYVSNNPINSVDSLGLCDDKDCMQKCLDSYGLLTELSDDLGWWGAGALAAGAAGEALGRIGDKLADVSTERLSRAAVESGKSIGERQVIAKQATKQIGKIAAKRAALATVSKVSGIGGAVATGISAGLRAHCAIECAGK